MLKVAVAEEEKKSGRRGVRSVRGNGRPRSTKQMHDE